MDGDTIVGVATAMGEGGVAIVRLSGPDAIAIFERAFVAAKRQPPYESHRLMYGHVRDGEAVIDEAMGVVMRAPNSYTREDVCELHTHGGWACATLTARLLERLGARVAEPGEFTRRAFLNGRIDLTQAEAVMGVINATSAAALKAELAQLSGGSSRYLRQAQDKLLSLLAGLEAHLDYPDEIDESEATDGLREGLDELIVTLRAAVDERGARILREGLRVALFGRPNAGKSTLFNALLGEERAIVTSVPGTTRDVLHGSFALKGVNVQLMDTAGLRQSGDEAERVGVERARQAVEQADAALLLIDATRPLDDEDVALLGQDLPCPCAVLLNTEDAQPVVTTANASALTTHAPVLSVSAKDSTGLDAVRAYLGRFIGAPNENLLTHERHIAAAKRALERLEQARATLQNGLPIDLADVDMHDALYQLGRVTGDSVDDKLLDEIFSGFCVGK